MPSSTPNLRVSPRTQSVQTIVQWIEEGRFPPDSRLPGEEHLAVSLGVARGTVRSALQHLVDQGILAKQPNRGHVVNQNPQSPTSSLLAGSYILIAEPTGADLSRIAGYSQALDFAAVRSLHEHGHHVIHMSPSRLSVEVCMDIIRGRPLGIMCGFEAFHRPNVTDYLERFHQAGIPVAVASERNSNFDRVLPGHRHNTAELIKRLAAQGHTRIARVWTIDPAPPWLQERNIGYEEGCRAAGLSVLPPILALGPYLRSELRDPDAFMQRTRTFAGYLVDSLRKAQRPDALLAITDADAVAIIAAIRLCGLEPEKDIDVIGYDGYWSTCWEREFEPFPPLFSVDKNNTEIGRRLVETLMERNLNPNLPPKTHYVASRIETLR